MLHASPKQGKLAKFADWKIKLGIFRLHSPVFLPVQIFLQIFLKTNDTEPNFLSHGNEADRILLSKEMFRPAEARISVFEQKQEWALRKEELINFLVPSLPLLFPFSLEAPFSFFFPSAQTDGANRPRTYVRLRLIETPGASTRLSYYKRRVIKPSPYCTLLA